MGKFRTYGMGGLLLLACSWPSHATVFISENFNNARLEDTGWFYKAGWCNFNQPSRTDPCPEIDVTTTQFVSGPRALKLHYDAAWSDPNPQTHTQAIARLPGVMASASQKDLWTAYWYKAPGFQYTAASSTKQIYFKNTKNTAPTFIGNFFWGGARGTDDNHLSGAGELGMGVQGMDDTCPTSGKPAPSECGFYPNMASIPLNDNIWRCVEEHIHFNDPGLKNGHVEIFINNTQTLGYYGLRFLSASPYPSHATQPGCVYPTNGGCGYVSPTTAIDLLEIYKQNGHGDKYFDGLVVASTRQGCPGAQSSDAVPPAPPSNFRVTQLLGLYASLMHQLGLAPLLGV